MKRRRRLLLGASILLLGLCARPAPAPAIVDGNAAAITSFPFQVALYDPSAGSPYEGEFCGGVILDAWHVATAAHCVLDAGSLEAAGPSAVAVLAGSARLRDAAEGPYAAPAVQDPAQVVSFDPEYEPQSNENDIALITLAEPLYSGSPTPDGATAIAPVPVLTAAQAETAADPNAASPPPVTLSGWGDTLPEDAQPAAVEYPQELQAAQTRLVPDAGCAGDYAGLNPITPAMICAGLPEGGPDACYGDSGGPLVVDTATPADPPADYALVGVTDFAEGCGLAGYPGVYVRTSEPAIRAFLESSPPNAPGPVAAPALSGSPEVGQTLTCTGPAAPAGTTLRYGFFADVAGEAVALAEPQGSGLYTVSAADAGASVFCRVEAVNAGGFSYADSAPVSILDPAAPPPPPPVEPGGEPGASATGGTVSGATTGTPSGGAAGAGGEGGTTGGQAAGGGTTGGAGTGGETTGGAAEEPIAPGIGRVISPRGPRIALIGRHCERKRCRLLVKVTGKGSLRARAARVHAAVRAGATGRFTVTVTGLPRRGRSVKLMLTLVGGRGQVIVRRGVSLRG